MEFDEALEILVGNLGSWEEPFAVRARALGLVSHRVLGTAMGEYFPKS